MGSLFGDNEQSTSQSQESTTNTELYQQEFLDKLLSGAEDWLNQGGLQNQPDISGQLGNILGQAGEHYQGVLSGQVDQTALNNALQSQADMAQQTFERNILPAIGTTSNLTGSESSSRRGIAEGLAASDMQSQLMANQNQTINQFQQQAMQNQMNAANSMQSLFGQGAALQQILNSQTDGAKQLQSLMAFKDLISGNMGGTTSSTGTSTGTTSGGNNAFGQLLGAGATIVGGMATGGTGFFSSDEKLKKNEKVIGRQRLKDGSFIDIYEWEWNEEAKKLGLSKAPTVGVLAQEARKVVPESVVKGTNGYLAVNYGKLAKEFDSDSETMISKNSKTAKKAIEGLKEAIAGPEGKGPQAQGSQKPQKGPKPKPEQPPQEQAPAPQGGAQAQFNGVLGG